MSKSSNSGKREFEKSIEQLANVVDTNTKIDKIPVYDKIYRILKKRIIDGKYDKSFPTEKILCEEFSVSRLTLRKSLEELKRERFIASEKGRGTYVLENKHEEELSVLTGLTQEAKHDGFNVKSKVLKNTLVKPSQELLEIFKMPTKSMVVYLERVRYLNNEPYGIERSYLNPMLDIRLLSLVEKDFSVLSLYEVLKNEYEIDLKYADESIEIIKLNEKELKLLEMKNFEYGILRHRYTYIGEGHCIEYVESIYRGDKYKLKVKRSSI